MWGPTFSRPHARTVALVDCAPGAVSAALLELPQHGPARVITEAHSLIALDKRTDKGTTAALKRHIEEVSARVIAAAGTRARSLDALYVVVHAPWARSQTIVADTQFDGESAVHDDAIIALAKKSVESLGQKGADTRLFEARVSRIWLNGYPTHDIAGKSAHELSVATTLSDCDTDVQVVIDSALPLSFPAPRTSVHSAMHAMLTVMAAGESVDEKYVAVDVGVDSTHIVSLRHGTVTGQASVSEGVRTILTRIGKEHPPEETLGLVRMLGKDACEDGACEEVRGALAAAELELAHTFGECFAGIAGDRRLPNRLILSAPRDLSDWLQSFFARIDFAQFTVTTQPFAVAPIQRMIGNLLADADTLDGSIALGATLALSAEEA